MFGQGKHPLNVTKEFLWGAILDTMAVGRGLFQYVCMQATEMDK